jgi:hypothetical protein
MYHHQRKVKKDLLQIGFKEQVKVHPLQDKIKQGLDNQTDLLNKIKVVQDQIKIRIAQGDNLTYLKIFGYGKLQYRTI